MNYYFSSTDGLYCLTCRSLIDPADLAAHCEKNLNFDVEPCIVLAQSPLAVISQ